MGTIVLLGDVEGPAKEHVGDEAMLTAAVDWLRSVRPADRIVAASADPATTAQRHGVETFREPAWTGRLAGDVPASALGRVLGRHPRLARTDALAFARAVAHADALYLCGGGNLRSAFPESVRLRTVAAECALAAGVPVFAAGQTLGPDLDRPTRRMLRRWLPRVAWLGVRDLRHGPAWARVLRVPAERVRCQPDEAWELGAEDPPEATWRALEWLPRPRVVASLHHQAGGRLPPDALDRALVRALDALAAAGAGIVLLPHVTGTGGGDVPRLERLHARMRRPGSARVQREPLRDRAVKGLTATADLVVSTRYHGLVFALSAGVPAVGVVQDDYTRVKLAGAFESVGLRPRLVDADAPDLAPRLALRWQARARDACAARRGAQRGRRRLRRVREELAKRLDALPESPRWT